MSSSSSKSKPKGPTIAKNVAQAGGRIEKFCTAKEGIKQDLYKLSQTKEYSWLKGKKKPLSVINPLIAESVTPDIRAAACGMKMKIPVCGKKKRYCRRLPKSMKGDKMKAYEDVILPESKNRSRAIDTRLATRAVRKNPEAKKRANRMGVEISPEVVEAVINNSTSAPEAAAALVSIANANGTKERPFKTIKNAYNAMPGLKGWNERKKKGNKIYVKGKSGPKLIRKDQRPK